MRETLTRLAAAGTLALALGLGGCATSPEMRHAGEDFDKAKSAYLAGDYGRALPLLSAEAERGVPRAQYTLGYMYYNGQGVEQDTDQALQWIRRAANNGDPLAVEALSTLAGTMTERPNLKRGQPDREGSQQAQEQAEGG